MNSYGSSSAHRVGPFALAALFLAAAAGAQSPAPLFHAAATPTAAQTEANPFALREAFVSVDWRAFSAARRPADVTQLLNLNLFEDARYLAERVKLNWLGPNRFDWIGQIGDDDVILAVRDGHMVGVVQKGQRVFEVRSVNGFTHQITETNQAKYAELDQADDLVPEAGHESIVEEKLPPGPEPAKGSLTIIDVMVAYNQPVLTKNPSIEAYLGSLIALSNRAYERSLIPQQIRLVHHYLATACATSNANSCNNTNSAVVAKRTQYGADITGYIHDGSAGFCGVSNGGCCQTTIYSCALGNKSFPHEFGHNMGAGHDAAQSGGSGYAHGWIDTNKKWRTVMAYPCRGGNCPRVDNFSNPTVMQDGRTTGNAQSADNARRMRERMASVAARQPTKVPVNVNEQVIVDPKADFSVRGLGHGTLDLRLSKAEKLTIAFFSLSGKRRTVAANQEFPSGDNHVAWKPETLSPGVNILMIRGRKTQKTFKLMAMR